MKMIVKIFIAIVIFLNCINISQVYASQVKGTDASGGAEKSTSTKDDTTTDWKDGFKYADEFISKGASEKPLDEKKLKEDASGIFSILLAVGTSLTVIVGAILGISFMLASAEDKANIKEKMIPYVIGCVVIYGAFTIWYIVVQVLEKIE